MVKYTKYLAVKSVKWLNFAKVGFVYNANLPATDKFVILYLYNKILQLGKGL